MGWRSVNHAGTDVALAGDMKFHGYVLGCVCAAATLVTAAACTTDQSLEEKAVRAFHQQLESGQHDLIYANSSEFLRGQLSEAQFRRFLAETRRLGRFQETERAQYRRTKVPGQPDLIVAFYNSRYERASCLESFTWRVEATGLKLATYSCAPNMKVTCPGGVAGTSCETSPVPAPGIAGLP
jgi:hypothetical protein